MPQPTPTAANRTRSRTRPGARRAAALLAVLLAVLLLAPGTAWAGGPTSVLLASPTTDRAAALYTADPAYAQLEALLADPGRPVSGPPEDGSGQYVTATWLVHDVTVWRIDRIFLDRDDGIRVVTRTTDATVEPAALAEGMWPGEPGGPDPTWHRPTDQAALAALLDGLGLLDPAPGLHADVAAVPAAELRAAAAPTAPAPGPPARGDGPWWWAGAGALLGAVAAVLGLRASTGLRRRLLSTPVGR